MASLMTAAQKEKFRDHFSGHFDTFNRDIIIHKEPSQSVVTNPDPNIYPGYGGGANEEIVTYTPRSGIFQALVKYDRKQKFGELTESRFTISQGQVLIKVNASGRNYIEEGANEAFEVDGLLYNKISDQAVQNYLGLEYYYYLLERTS